MYIKKFLKTFSISALLLHSVCACAQTNTSADFKLTLFADNFTSPTVFRESPDGTKRFFIGEQSGKIYLIKEGKKQETPFIDLTSRLAKLGESYDERGLLGFTFHPDFRQNGKFYIYYSAPLQDNSPKEFDHSSLISEFKVSTANPDIADISTERILLKIDQPQGNHNGGDLAFGKDGFLYISVGDGGARDDKGTGHPDDWYTKNEGGNGQHLNALGSILRIDVNNGNPYSIPKDNPYATTDGSKEVYATGLRNPYRISFDRQTGNLYTGDVGQEYYEEVNIVKKGGNYGWNVLEGKHCFDSNNPTKHLKNCPQQDANGKPLLPPVIEYVNAKQKDGIGYSVIGGFVYRGSSIPSLKGSYVFGDWKSSNGEQGVLLISKSDQPENALWKFNKVDVSLDGYLLGFGEDETGELYILTTKASGPSGKSGKVFKLEKK